MLLGSKEVAVALGISERSARRLFECREIRAFQIGKTRRRGRLWRTRREILDDYLRENLGEIPALVRRPIPPARMVSAGSGIRALTGRS